jgi:hypothetical protein
MLIAPGLGDLAVIVATRVQPGAQPPEHEAESAPDDDADDADEEPHTRGDPHDDSGTASRGGVPLDVVENDEWMAWSR